VIGNKDLGCKTKSEKRNRPISDFNDYFFSIISPFDTDVIPDLDFKTFLTFDNHNRAVQYNFSFKFVTA
jgi:hypothetical protein